MSSGSLIHPDDGFGESEHQSFLHRLLNFLEYYRKKISSLVIYIPIGKILISCFNYLCSFLLKYAGFRVDPIFEPVQFIHLGIVDDGGNPKVVEEVRRIEESFNAEMTEEREKMEQIMKQVENGAVEYERKFKEAKERSLKKIQEVRENANQEQDETAEQSGRLLSRERASEVNRQNLVKINEELSSILDGHEIEDIGLTPLSTNPQKKKNLKNN